EILEEVTGHAKAAYRNDGCGWIVGGQGAERFIPMRNISPSAAHYEMDPAELIATLRDLRQTGEDLIAIYHSHPHGPAEPSKTDVERAYYPQAAQLIVSLADPQGPRTGAFRIIDGEATPLEGHAIV